MTDPFGTAQRLVGLSAYDIVSHALTRIRRPSGLNNTSFGQALVTRVSIGLPSSELQIRTVRYVVIAAKLRPSGLKLAYPPTEESGTATIFLPVRASHTAGPLLSDEVNTRVPLGLNIAVTKPPGRGIARICLPELASQIRAVPSRAAVRTRVPSGLNIALSSAS